MPDRLDRRSFLGLGVGAAAAVAVLDDLLAQPTPVAGATPVRLLLVHGRAQQGKDPVQLKAEWMETLARGAEKNGQTLAEGLEVAFPFYGDALDAFTREAQVPLTSEVHTRGELNDDFLRFEAEMAEALRQQAGITEEQIDAEYGENPKPKGPQNWEWVQAILRTLDQHGGGLSQLGLEQFMRDVFLYTTRKRVQREIDGIVRALLTEQPTVVVGHSLGSVVAYNVLRSDHRRLRVPLFLTVGSPLGVRPIRRSLRPLEAPPNVDAWFNAYDRRDVVALYPLDGQNFPVTPAVENYNGVRNGTENRHGIVGYLDDDRVAARIVQALIT
jgi:hypothetical protein